MKVFVFDANKCNGCYGCQLACKDEHVGNDWMPYAKPQPDLGSFWMKLTEKTHGQAPKVRLEYRPVFCQHCADPVCIKNSDAFYKREDGLVILDPEKAGDKALLDACPYGVIYWNPALNIAQKCTGCAQLVDGGELPHCVDVCATGALRFGEYEEFADELVGAEPLVPELAGNTSVYYLNTPHLFISGEVWDPIANEIIEGAKVTLTCPGGTVRETESDDFGDFWFRKLKEGEYTIKIETKGYQAVEKIIKLDKSLNIGDFPLEKA